jgi:hypothetical protein
LTEARERNRDTEGSDWASHAPPCPCRDAWWRRSERSRIRGRRKTAALTTGNRGFGIRAEAEKFDVDDLDDLYILAIGLQLKL